MSKAKLFNRENEPWVAYLCPGCKHNHSVPAARWSFNGSLESPTLSPSVRHFFPAGDHGPEETICHYFIINGNIQFCNDCKHALNGQTVPLPEMIEEDNE